MRKFSAAILPQSRSILPQSRSIKFSAPGSIWSQRNSLHYLGEFRTFSSLTETFNSGWRREYKNVIDEMWRKKSSGIILHAICNKCGGSSVSNCECVRKEFYENVTFESVQKFLEENRKLWHKKFRVLQTVSTDPFFNIGCEEDIFQTTSIDTLFLWRNRSNIVIGRTQNPHEECHLQKMSQDGVPLIRRSSGGGAVYQDEGNSIFTFISPLTFNSSASSAYSNSTSSNSNSTSSNSNSNSTSSNSNSASSTSSTSTSPASTCSTNDDNLNVDEVKKINNKIILRALVDIGVPKKM